MLKVHRFNASSIAALMPKVAVGSDLSPAEWEAACEGRGLAAFAAIGEEGDVAGLALAESGPQALHVVAIEGRPAAYQLLLGILVKLAGERDVTAWCPVGDGGLRGLLEGLGFSMTQAADTGGCDAYFYRLCRNGEV